MPSRRRCRQRSEPMAPGHSQRDSAGTSLLGDHRLRDSKTDAACRKNITVHRHAAVMPAPLRESRLPISRVFGFCCARVVGLPR
jgi:hypothetical protein